MNKLLFILYYIYAIMVNLFIVHNNMIIKNKSLLYNELVFNHRTKNCYA